MIKRILPFLVFLLCSANADAWTRVQRVVWSGTGAKTITSTTAGNLLIVTQGLNAGCTFLGTPTDNKGGGTSIYVNDVVATALNGECVSVWSTANIASGITTVSISVTSSQVGGFIEEWSGGATSTPFDKSSTNGSTASQTSLTSNATATLTGSADLAIGFFSTNTGTLTWTPTNGFGDGANNHNGVSGNDSYIENKVLAANTAVAATGTLSGGGAGYDGVIATYKAPAAGGAVRKRASVINQ